MSGLGRQPVAQSHFAWEIGNQMRTSVSPKICDGSKFESILGFPICDLQTSRGIPRLVSPDLIS